ncbi:PPC domain-containing DNA-binding protein [Haloquadratum walsbyi]|jgi:Predicted DNA-binding protein with PD1-like DNA-binding motif|uniref:Putative PD1-like DNA-binding protein n=1 Tax=Haloquadratum walsbyi J07HQW2 TaxID=1238425 RepID=U1PTG6_9EURY|nr:PPC domain-containing DNA-binding protein [Haloquadratum walsbyi]ERG95676.1 MAG: putative PD1-like DNA-binding protein [Haloquadratum walsbyi J07HQW2]
MHYREVDTAREFLLRLETGADWRAEIEEFAKLEDIDAAWFNAMGAVQDAEVWFYDQTEAEYNSVSFDEPLEIAACIGNIAMLDDERFAHTHAVLSRPSGQALAGHLNAGTVFAGEVYLRALDTDLIREYDETTGLDVWL